MLYDLIPVLISEGNSSLLYIGPKFNNMSELQVSLVLQNPITIVTSEDLHAWVPQEKQNSQPSFLHGGLIV